MSEWDQDYQDEVRSLGFYFQNINLIWEHDIDYDFE